MYEIFFIGAGIVANILAVFFVNKVIKAERVVVRAKKKIK